MMHVGMEQVVRLLMLAMVCIVEEIVGIAAVGIAFASEAAAGPAGDRRRHQDRGQR